jgi:hypothetical protein
MGRRGQVPTQETHGKALRGQSQDPLPRGGKPKGLLQGRGHRLQCAKAGPDPRQGGGEQQGLLGPLPLPPGPRHQDPLHPGALRPGDAGEAGGDRPLGGHPPLSGGGELRQALRGGGGHPPQGPFGGVLPEKRRPGDPLICENAILALGLAEEKELSEIQATTLKVGSSSGPSSPRGGWTSGTSSWSSGATGARSFWPTRSAPTPCGFARTGSLWTRTASAGTWGRGGGLPGGPEAGFGE